MSEALSGDRSGIVGRIRGEPVQFGGEEHSGWLPAGAAKPLPTPVQNVVVDVEIIADGDGYLLCWSAQDGSIWGDTWHRSLTDALDAATEQLGVEASRWERV